MHSPLYNQNAEQVGAVELSEKLFGVKGNPALVHQVAVSEESNRRTAGAHTKDRSEVRGGGRKPWRQKGTGRARHGSIRSPLWRHGGVTHGPRSGKRYEKKINKKMRRKAVALALSQKLRDNEILFISTLSFPQGRTKEGAGLLQKLSSLEGFEPLGRGAKTLVALPAPDKNVTRALRNIVSVDVKEARNITTSDVLRHRYLLILEPASGVLEKTFAS